MRKIMGGLSICLALAIAILPMFTDCQSQGKAITLANGKTVPMKCHWTGVAELGIAVPLAMVGVFEIFSKRKESNNILSSTGGALGIMAILFPTALIGVCSNPMMLCNSVEKPGLIALGALTIGVSAVVFFTSRKIAEPGA